MEDEFDDNQESQRKVFPNGKDTLKFDDFLQIIRDSCGDQDMAENYLVLAFSMFDR